MALLAAKSLGLCHSYAADAHFVERFFNLIKLERFDDRFNFFHGAETLPCAYPLCTIQSARGAQLSDRIHREFARKLHSR